MPCKKERFSTKPLYSKPNPKELLFLSIAIWNDSSLHDRCTTTLKHYKFPFLIFFKCNQKTMIKILLKKIETSPLYSDVDEAGVS
jgi:hypothetical protein